MNLDINDQGVQIAYRQVTNFSLSLIEQFNQHASH